MSALDLKELQNELKKKQICRFCLSVDPESLTNILICDFNNSSSPLRIQVMAIASIEIFGDDDMPPYACSDCISIFEYSYQFKQMCKKADNLLRQYPLVGKWPKSLKKPTMPKTLLTKLLLEQNNIISQEDPQHTTKNLPQESLLLPKKILNVDTEVKGKASNNVTNNKKYLPKVEKMDDECNITYLEKIDNSDNLPMDDSQILVDSEEAESEGMEKLQIVVKRKLLDKSSDRILNKDASLENEPRLSLPQNKNSEDGNMEMEAESNDKFEEEPDKKNGEPIETNIFPCPHCERSFPLAQLRNLHLKIHLRDRQFPCSQCNKSFFNKQALEKHLLLHNAERPFKCTACDKGFNRAVCLTRHLKTHTDIPKHTCDHCGKTFASKEDMDRHVKRHNMKRPFQCKTCNKSFKRKDNLYNHEAVHLSLQPFPCQYCDQSFPNESKLYRHLMVHAGNRPYPCKYCKKSYTKSQNLTQHLRSHKNIDKSYFLCPTCKTRFKARSKLIRHSKTHVNEQNLTCPLCKETFENMKILGTHVQDHSEGEAYVCEFCDLIFITAEKLQYHTDLDHTSEMELHHADDRAQADKMMENSIKDEIDIGEESLQSTVNVFLMGELSDGGKNLSSQIERKIKSEKETSPSVIIQYESEQTKNDEINLSEESLQSTVNEFHIGKLSDGGENVNNVLKRKIKTEQETLPKIVNEIIIQNETEQTKIDVIENQVDDNASLLIPLKQRKTNLTDKKFSTAQAKQQNKQSLQLKHEVANAATSTMQSLLKVPEKIYSPTGQNTLLNEDGASSTPSSKKASENKSGIKAIEKKVKVQKIRVTKAEADAMVKDGRVVIKDGKIILKRKTSKTIV